MKYFYSLLAMLVFAFSYAQTDKPNSALEIHATNFRDLGGYPTQDGRMVKYNKLFRSGDLSRLTDADWEKLKAKNVETVVDFRSDDEVKKAKDHLAEGVQYINLPAGSAQLKDFQKAMLKAKEGDSLMISFYSQTDHLQEKYAPFFQTLLKTNSNDSTIFHCTAGKDRTGIGAALLLYALGVSPKIIMDDYLLSNIYRKDENEKMVNQMVETGFNKQVALDVVSVKPSYLEATYYAITKKYGSVDNFLQKELNLSNNDLKKLQELYTEKTATK